MNMSNGFNGENKTVASFCRGQKELSRMSCGRDFKHLHKRETCSPQRLCVCMAQAFCNKPEGAGSIRAFRDLGLL